MTRKKRFAMYVLAVPCVPVIFAGIAAYKLVKSIGILLWYIFMVPYYAMLYSWIVLKKVTSVIRKDKGGTHTPVRG